MTSTTIIAIFAAAALSVGTLAIAANAAEATSVRVVHADLDLNTAAGRKTLDARIAAASRRVCGDAFAPVSLPTSRAVRDCRVATRADARAQADRAIAQAKGADQVASTN